MREQRRWAGTVLVLFALSGSVWSDGPLKSRVMAADRQEADLVAPVLAEELAVLREQADRLQVQVDELTVQLAKKELQADQVEVRRTKMTGFESVLGEPKAAEPLVVLEVNRELALVVLDGGRSDGLKAGLMLAVLQGDAVVAKVRVVEVREEISGARIVRVLGDGYPQPGNRVVIWRTSME